MREKVVERAIRQWLRDDGWLTMKYHGSAYTDNGVPDLLAVRDGRFAAIECKSPGKEPTPVQRRWIATIRSFGAVAFFATSLEEARAKMERGLAGKQLSDD